jgi:NAD(P)-dependent dehydrogenase (short-subunit alcohol dehydrogenase family)
MKLQGKAVLITDADSFFGRAGSLLFVRERAIFLVVDINDKAGKKRLG